MVRPLRAYPVASLVQLDVILSIRTEMYFTCISFLIRGAIDKRHTYHLCFLAFWMTRGFFNACATRQLTVAHKCVLCVYNGALDRHLVQLPSEGL